MCHQVDMCAPRVKQYTKNISRDIISHVKFWWLRTSSLERFLQMRRIWESDSFIISWCNFCYRSWITDKNLNFNLERKIGVYLIHSISQMTAKSPPVGFAKNYRLLKSLYEYIIKKIVFLKNMGLRNKRWRIRYIVIKIANPLTNFPNLLLLLLV